MKTKVFLALILALGVGLYIPQSRARILEAARPALNPLYRFMTRGELERIARDLVDYEKTHFRLPEIRDFPEWMDERYGDTALTRDAWENPYRLRPAGPATFHVVSAGVDGEFGTEDDLLSPPVRPDPRRR